MPKVRLYGTFTEVRAGAKPNSDRGGRAAAAARDAMRPAPRGPIDIDK